MAISIDTQVSMSGQKHYEKAIAKYGERFADAVVESELQLHADNLNCFVEYAEYDFMQDVLTDSLNAKNEG